MSAMVRAGTASKIDRYGETAAVSYVLASRHRRSLTCRSDAGAVLLRSASLRFGRRPSRRGRYRSRRKRSRRFEGAGDPTAAGPESQALRQFRASFQIGSCEFAASRHTACRSGRDTAADTPGRAGAPQKQAASAPSRQQASAPPQPQQQPQPQPQPQPQQQPQARQQPQSQPPPQRRPHSLPSSRRSRTFRSNTT